MNSETCSPEAKSESLRAQRSPEEATAVALQSGTAPQQPLRSNQHEDRTVNPYQTSDPQPPIAFAQATQTSGLGQDPGRTRDAFWTPDAGRHMDDEGQALQSRELEAKILEGSLLSEHTGRDDGGHAAGYSNGTGDHESSEYGVDPEVLASLPPDIQRELKLASMARLGNPKTAQQRHPKTAQQRPDLGLKARKVGLTDKKKKASIAKYFSAKQ